MHFIILFKTNITLESLGAKYEHRIQVFLGLQLLCLFRGREAKPLNKEYPYIVIQQFFKHWKHHFRLFVFMETSLKKWWCDPCYPFFITSISLVHLKKNYNTKLEDQDYFIHMFSPLWEKEEVFIISNTIIYKCSKSRAYFTKFKEAKRGTYLNFLHAFLEYQSSLQQLTISYNSWNSSAHHTDGEEHVSDRARNLHRVPSDSDLQLVAPG